MAEVEVKNKIGTGEDTPPCCGSWIEHFRNQTHGKGGKCYAIDCGATDDILGAHVYKPGHSDEVFIVPLCDSCNKRADTFKVMTPLAAVEACN